MTEVAALREDNEALRAEILQLRQRVLDSEQAADAFAHGEVDAVAFGASATPVLLHAAQEKLRRSEALFRAVIESSSEVVSLTFADATTRYLTPAAAEQLGWAAGELDAPSLLDRVVAEDRPRVDAELDRVVRNESKDFSMEFRVQRRDGSILWWEASGRNLLADPHVAAIVTTYRNITPRKQAEEATQESERRFRHLIEELPQPVLVQMDEKVLYANAASASAIGFAKAEELTHRVIPELFPSARATVPSPPRTGVIADDADIVECSFRRPNDGREVHAEIKSIPIVYDGQSATLTIVHDVTRRVNAEREVAQSLQDADLERRKLEAVLAALPVGVWIATAEGRLTQSNPAAARIWGGRAPHAESFEEYGVYQAWFQSTGQAVGPDDWALTRTLKTGATIVAEPLDIRRFDGTIGHVLHSTAPILDERGHMAGGVVVTLDVSDAYRAARERDRLNVSLEHERGRLATLLEKAPAFIAVLRGNDHVFDFVNESYRQLVRGRDIIGRRVIDVFPELVNTGVIARLDNVFHKREPFFVTGLAVPFVHHPGAAPETRYLDVMYQAFVEVDGTTSGVFLHGVDVTDATLAQKRLRAQFNGVPVPTYVWQRIERDGAQEFVLVDFNQAAITLSRGGIETHRGESALSYFCDEPAVLEELARCLEDGMAIQREMDRVLKTTGEKRRLFVTYASSPPDLVIVHTEDVTERTKLEEQFRQAQKMEAVGRLAGGIAHDFNNLLTVILSYSDLAIHDLKPEDPLRADVLQIEEAGKRAADLTRQLLAFSRQQMLQLRVLDLPQIVSAMKSMLGRLLGEDVQLSLVIAPDVGRVLADPGQIEQVVMNLAVNARDAMPDGGTLTIELSNVTVPEGAPSDGLVIPPGDYVFLVVSDTGTGMDADTRARIFEPFFTTKEKGKGTGLGLSTVFGIIEQSGGYVDVTSAPGVGSTFKIYLSRTDLEVASDLGPAAPLLQRGSETVLVVEDEDQLRVVACAILRRNGYRVLEAANGGEALLISKEFDQTIDLLLTDVVMPRMSGRKLATHLTPERPTMKVLYTSGYTDDAILHHGVLAENVAFLNKPFTPQVLLRKVREVLDARVVGPKSLFAPATVPPLDDRLP